MAYEIPPLPYDYSALEPHIDAETMKLHHDKHHAAYVSNLNGAVEKHPELGKHAAEDLLRISPRFPKMCEASSATMAAATSITACSGPS